MYLEFGFEGFRELRSAEGAFEIRGVAEGGGFVADLCGGEDLGPVGGGDEEFESVVVEPGFWGVGGGGGPGVEEGVSDDAGADGVEFDVSEGGEQVSVLEDAGEISVLPEAAGADEAAVEVGGVLAVDGLHETGDRVGFVGAGEEMVVIGHEAVGEDVDVAGCRVAGEEIKEVVAIAVGVEGGLAVVAALGDVKVVAGGSEAGATWHGGLGLCIGSGICGRKFSPEKPGGSARGGGDTARMSVGCKWKIMGWLWGWGEESRQ